MGDGSTDATECYIQRCMRKGKIQIQYEEQEKQGKAIAHNRGVELTQTELNSDKKPFCFV